MPAAIEEFFITACEYIHKKLPCTTYHFMPFGMKGNPTNISDSPPFPCELRVYSVVKCSGKGRKKIKVGQTLSYKFFDAKIKLCQTL
jgi:hypothetical protein